MIIISYSTTSISSAGIRGWKTWWNSRFFSSPRYALSSIKRQRNCSFFLSLSLLSLFLFPSLALFYSLSFSLFSTGAPVYCSRDAGRFDRAGTNDGQKTWCLIRGIHAADKKHDQKSICAIIFHRERCSGRNPSLAFRSKRDRLVLLFPFIRERAE